MNHDSPLPVPFENSYWAVEKNLLAGCYPSSLIAEQKTQMLEGLLDVDVRHIVNLTSDFEWDNQGGYEAEMSQLAAARNQVVVFRQFPIFDGCVPSIEFMQDILADIEDALWSDRGAVYVHCWAGRGRTGTVIGCFLARSGVAIGEDVLTEMAKLRSRMPNGHKESPETEEQREFVRNWKLNQ